jgi:VTC domain
MDRVKLQDRTDTKFIFAHQHLAQLLEACAQHYSALHVKGQGWTDYRTLYFDTPTLRCFQDHHNGRTRRSKVRQREYVGSGLCFLEVKRKTGTGRTDKVRERIPELTEIFDLDFRDLVARASGSSGPWLPQLWNHFSRITLVHHQRPERLTLDLGISFQQGTRSVALPNVVVAELKQERADRGSPFTEMMRVRGIRPTSMSKYCSGVLLLGLSPKHNLFKPTLLRLQRLQASA